MKVTRFFETADGGSRFEDLEIPALNVVDDSWGNRLATGESFVSPAVRLFEVRKGTFQDWHNAPQRQLCVMLSGVWEVGTTDGETRRWEAGELFLPDDVTGTGHTSRVVEPVVRILFVPLPDDLDLDNWRTD